MGASCIPKERKEKMKTFSEIIKNIFKIKSLWSITAMIICLYGTFTGTLSSEISSMLIGSIITYYFTKREAQ